jgi:hypothetical protein
MTVEVTMEGLEPLNDVVTAALVSRRPNQLRQTMGQEPQQGAPHPLQADTPVNPG